MKLLTSSTLAKLVAAGMFLCAGALFAADDQGKPATKGTKSSEPSVIAPTKPFAPIDINTAKKEEFKKLNGVTESDADRIIAGRPYLSKYALVTDKIISEALFQTIKVNIVAKQPDAKKKPNKTATTP